ncbi:DUF1206 domain-containing protein [Cognatishimia sp. F0-27]|uniref:DUF1206 domain-containing protein n=1 Tax=Cognatishimia sp. F0-27 TaxID=2816855 RepID=UPI001D0C8B63|nr:DUF1206 domain-containing protein [Cognatishimia sp. F0-27]MCC1495003.1 DUF1206 domain-containing protein [Cognatishimia sp. F0-27]
MANKAPAWVMPVMRAGHAARGLVYTVVGALALLAALNGGAAEGTRGALGAIRNETWGVALLWVIAIGLLAYALWRWIDSLMDLDAHGHDLKGSVARAGLLVTGAIHAALGVSVARIALQGGSGGQSGAESMTARVLELPYGVWLVAAVAIATIGAGVYYARKGAKGLYREDIRTTRVTQRLDPLMKAGFVAQGGVVATIGVFILFAAMASDASEAGGLGAVFGEVRSQPYGRILLGALALGLLAFAAENFIEAIYRIVPRRAGDEIETLASRMKREARHAARKSADAVGH